jgi:hypothetical protein
VIGTCKLQGNPGGGGAFMRVLWPHVAVLTASIFACREAALSATISAVDSKDGKTRLDLVGDVTTLTRSSLRFKKLTVQIVSS